jgi:hypothetical protein
MRAGIIIAAAVAGLALALAGFSPLSPASGATKLSADLPSSVAMLVKTPKAEIEQAERAPKVLGISRAKLNSIASCESGGDPTSVSSDGTYRGKYQFDLSAWESVGGHGDPAKAPALEQDYRAAQLAKSSGFGRWPNCG